MRNKNYSALPRCFMAGIVLLLNIFNLHAQTLHLVKEAENCSIRAVSVADAGIVWVSGSNGWFARSVDGGYNWAWKQAEGYEKFDFRGLYAFSAETAILMSSGSPGILLRTTDGGNSWTEVYRNESKEIFFDGISFYNRDEGIVYGDPIGGKMQLLKTNDGGISWINIADSSNIRLAEGEASFAASNTGICTDVKGNTWVLTGGKQARIFFSDNKGLSWSAGACPVLSGESKGPFSVDFFTRKKGIVVGGDYKTDSVRTRVCFITQDGGLTWKQPDKGPGGFRSCVVYMTAKVLLATGTSGTDISRDGGNNWASFSKESFNVVAALDKKTAILAGSKGRIAVLKL